MRTTHLTRMLAVLVLSSPAGCAWPRMDLPEAAPGVYPRWNDVHVFPVPNSACTKSLAALDVPEGFSAGVVIDRFGSLVQLAAASPNAAVRDVESVLRGCRFVPGKVGDVAIQTVGTITLVRASGRVYPSFVRVSVPGGSIQPPVGPCVPISVTYPKDAVRLNIQGTVKVAVVVDADGNLSDPQFMEAPSSVLMSGALNMVRQCRMVPAAFNSQRIPLRIVHFFTYRIE